MLRKFSSSRTLKQNIQLGSITAFSAGMVNVSSVMIFFAFTSNVTGHYAILAEEIARRHWYQVAVVFGWIFLFFFGNFLSNLIIINFNKKNAYIAHALPLMLEIACLFTVGIYGLHYYEETLVETEFMVALMLFAMGLQNGLTASISNFAVKTTHLTGLTTDLGILFSMFTQKSFRKNPELVDKAKLLVFVAFFYLTGGVFGGIVYLKIDFAVFFIVCVVLLIVILYDYYTLTMAKLMRMTGTSRKK